MSSLILLPKQLKQEIKQVLDESLIEVEDENRGSWTLKCNSCHRTMWMSKWILNKKTGRCALLEEQYFPQTGQIAKKHNCMFRGQGYWINKYDGSLQWARDVVPDVDKVDERTKEIAVKRWKEKVGYQRLSEYEKEQLEFSRKYYDTYKRMEEHSFEY